MTIDAFNILSDGRAQPETIAPGAVLPHGFARTSERPLLDDPPRLLGVHESTVSRAVRRGEGR